MNQLQREFGYHDTDAAVSINSRCLNHLAAAFHQASVDAGFYTDLETRQRKERNLGEMLALIHSEVSEVLEGVRKGKQDDHLPHLTSEAVELADVLIRLFDYAGYRKIDLAEAVLQKFRYNTQREDHKLDNRAAAGGKKF